MIIYVACTVTALHSSYKFSFRHFFTGKSQILKHTQSHAGLCWGTDQQQPIFRLTFSFQTSTCPTLLSCFKINHIFPIPQTLTPWQMKTSTCAAGRKQLGADKTDSTIWRCFGGCFQMEKQTGGKFCQEIKRCNKPEGLHRILSLEGLKKVHRLQARVALSWAASSSKRKTSADSALKTFGRTLCSGMQSA